MNSIRILLLLLLTINVSNAQSLPMVVNMGMLDGVEVTSDNIFNFQIINSESKAKDITVEGVLVYRNSDLRMSFSFDTRVQPGLNVFSKNKVLNPTWNFSSNALKELFFDYKKLPQGTYQYCVTIALNNNQTEGGWSDPVDGCVYHTLNDIFLINLITPEDDAELYEYNPMLAWMVNYPFASSLKYKLRLAEVKDGQNNESAVTRNNLYYTANNIYTTSQIYPATAKKLKVGQPYAWTVDAYYKGILLGGAEAWRFTILEDSLFEETSAINTPYLDVRKEKVKDPVMAKGTLKLKYVLTELKVDTLSLSLYHNDQEIKMKSSKVVTKAGDNRFDIDFTESPRLKHMKDYTLYIKNKQRQTYIIVFKYFNPDFNEEK